MTTLANNPAFITALVALIMALTAYVQARTTRVRQDAQLTGLQKQVDQQQPALGSTTVVVPPGAGTVHVQSPAILEHTEPGA